MHKLVNHDAPITAGDWYTVVRTFEEGVDEPVRVLKFCTSPEGEDEVELEIPKSCFVAEELRHTADFFLQLADQLEEK